MRVCFFGIYDPDYSRNRVLMRGLRENGVEVVEARVDPAAVRGVARIIALVRAAKEAHTHPIDLVVVAFPGHTSMLLAKFLFKEKIIFDAFVSLYDSNVLDRKTHKSNSSAALVDWVLDWFSPRLADRVLLDTRAHVEYFVRTFGISRKKLLCVYLGTDPAIFYPREAALPGVFTMHFHGSYVPLQGIPYILDAAKLLEGEPIKFRIVGSGQESSRVEKKAAELNLRNVEFVGKVPLEKLPEYIAASHACLGIFGDTPKTQHVIPNKVYEYMAMGKPIITADTPAIREVFTNGNTVLLCPAASGTSLAAAVRRLKADAVLCQALGAEARILFEKKYSPKHLVSALLSELI